MDKKSALYSQYIIDGVSQELTPGEMLDECLARKDWREEPPQEDGQLLDESLDPELQAGSFDSWKVRDYLDMTLGTPRKEFPLAFSSQFTKLVIGRALSEVIWDTGHFRLGDIALDAEWRWNTSGIGSNAAFYASAQSASEYIDSLGLKLNSYSWSGAGTCSLDVRCSLACMEGEEEDFPVELPFRTEHPVLAAERKIPASLVDDPESWIIFVPMENCELRLGGSLLSEITGLGCEPAPEPSDPDYFIDCFEVIREMVEDGILLSGASVGDGGLLTTLKKMALSSAGGKVGAKINVNDLMNAYHEQDIIRILFSEVPGVVLQIRDEDYDYLDAEFVLQDVVFFPLGHPVHGKSEIKVEESGKSGIQSILESLIRSQSSEGED